MDLELRPFVEYNTIILIIIGNKISLFFLAHEGKYQILIELLTLNSNM